MKSPFTSAENRIRILLAVVAAAAWTGCSMNARPARAPRAHLETSPVRVTEIHFNPSQAQGKAEFIEIANVSTQPVDLSGWKVTGAGPVTLPKGTTLNAGQAAVLCKDTTALQKAFGAKVVPVAVFTGKLKGKGDSVRIEDPAGKVADEATYEEAMPPVKDASNTGRSIQRTTFSGDPKTSWKAADPTPGAWQATR